VTRRHEHRDSDERGVVLVLAAITLVTLLIFSSFAVDFGGAYNARRQDQSAADSAALAAGSPMLIANTQLVVGEVLDRLNANTNAGFTAADLNTCDGDTGTLPVVASVDGQNYNCVSFNAARTQVRVRVPPREYVTTFARLVGVDTIGHTAFAIAGTPPQGAFGGVLPFGVTAATGTGHICLKTGPGPLDSAPCDGPTSGNFGYLNFAHFGNEQMGTPTSCSGQGTNRIPANIAQGVDHDLSLYGVPPHGNTSVIDHQSCGAVAGPNAADTNTGATPNIVGNGLHSGTNFYDNEPARLRRRAPVTPDYFQWTNLGPYNLDDNPLWAFIPPGLTHLNANIPESCEYGVFVGPNGELPNMARLPSGLQAHLAGRSTNDRMLLLLSRCIRHYETGTWSNGGYSDSRTAPRCGAGACDDPVFARDDAFPGQVADIQQTPRFGYVPVLVETNFPPGASSPVRFARFRAIYIQRVCIGQPCAIEFDPGVGMSSSSADPRATGFTAFAFPDDMLPFEIGSPTAPMDRPSTAVLLR
jgi:Flp pilus assembly protein TadG